MVWSLVQILALFALIPTASLVMQMHTTVLNVEIYMGQTMDHVFYVKSVIVFTAMAILIPVLAVEQAIL